jgi:rhomboid family GlyGly-CTERM serine protease
MDLRVYTTTAVVAFAAAAVFARPGAAALAELTPAALTGGEVWRLLTGHLAHCSASHLLWDLGTFVALGAWLERRLGSRGLALALLVQALVISLGMLAALPAGLAAYRGLSGIDSGLFVLAALLLRRELTGLARLLPPAMLALFLGKAGWEFATGTTLFASSAGMVPVPLAHLLGAAAALAWLWRLLQYPNPFPHMTRSLHSLPAALAALALPFLGGCFTPPPVASTHLDLYGLTATLPGDRKDWSMVRADEWPGHESACDIAFMRIIDTGVTRQWPVVGLDYRIAMPGANWLDEAIEEAREPFFPGTECQEWLFEHDPASGPGWSGIHYRWQAAATGELGTLNPGTNYYREGIVFTHPDDPSLIVNIYFEERFNPANHKPPYLVVREEARVFFDSVTTTHIDPAQTLAHCFGKGRSLDETSAAAEYFLYHRDFASAYAWARQNLARARIVGDEQGMADALLQLGKRRRMMSNSDESELRAALELYDQAQSHYEAAGLPLGAAVCEMERVVVYGSQHRDAEACAHLEEARRWTALHKTSGSTLKVPVYMRGVKDFDGLIEKAAEELHCPDAPQAD